LAIMLAAPPVSSGAGHHAPRRTGAPQLRGAMITPNWSIPDSPFARSPDQQRAEIQDLCSMGGDLIRLHVDWSQLQPGDYEPIPPPADLPGAPPPASDPTPPAYDPGAQPEAQPKSALPIDYARDARLPGQYDPAYVNRLDQIMAWAGACHIKVIADLVGSPCWAIDPAPCDDGTWIFDAPPGGLFGPAAGYLLARYPQLYALEVWNEPNNSFWKGSPADYAALVEEAVAARNALGSRTKILAGAFLGDGSGYLEQLYQAGMHGQDGISIHPYSIDCAIGCNAFTNPVRGDSPFREAIGAAHWVMQRYHDPGGLYLTEFGFATCPAQPVCLAERTAGRWLALSLRVASRYRYIKGLTVFSMRDFAEPGDQAPRWDMRSGILRENLAPKPAFRSLKLELARLRH
jgi:hypothetical protein